MLLPICRVRCRRQGPFDVAFEALRDTGQHVAIPAGRPRLHEAGERPQTLGGAHRGRPAARRAASSPRCHHQQAPPHLAENPGDHHVQVCGPLRGAQEGALREGVPRTGADQQRTIERLLRGSASNFSVAARKQGPLRTRLALRTPFSIASDCSAARVPDDLPMWPVGRTHPLPERLPTGQCAVVGGGHQVLP